MSEENFTFMINVGLPFALVAGSFFLNKWIEKRHYRSIEQREAALRDVLVISSKYAPDMPTAPYTEMVMGSVVVSSNLFLNLLYSLQSIFGGRASAYESLLDRARREAVLRMRQSAKDLNAVMVVNVWLESSRIGTDTNSKGMCEVLAYGTAVIPS